MHAIKLIVSLDDHKTKRNIRIDHSDLEKPLGRVDWRVVGKLEPALDGPVAEPEPCHPRQQTGEGDQDYGRRQGRRDDRGNQHDAKGTDLPGRVTLQPGATNILALEKGQNRAEQRWKRRHQR